MPSKRMTERKRTADQPTVARAARPAKGCGSRGPYRKLSIKPCEGEPIAAFFPVRAFTPIREMNRAYAEWTITMLDGNKPEAAKRLGISLRTIYN